MELISWLVLLMNMHRAVALKEGNWLDRNAAGELQKLRSLFAPLTFLLNVFYSNTADIKNGIITEKNHCKENNCER